MDAPASEENGAQEPGEAGLAVQDSSRPTVASEDMSLHNVRENDERVLREQGMIGAPEGRIEERADVPLDVHETGCTSEGDGTDSGSEPACDSCDEDCAERDEHNFEERFIRTHLTHFDRALAEIRAGQKRSCWSWFILPSPPWIVNGYERGSGTNRYYALRTDEQAKAYLQFSSRGVNLRRNFLEIWEAAAHQLEGGVTFRHLLGVMDDPKARSSLRLFERISLETGDAEVHALCCRVMKLIGEKTLAERAAEKKEVETLGHCAKTEKKRRKD